VRGEFTQVGKHCMSVYLIQNLDASGVTEEGEKGRAAPWQAKCKNWAPYS